MCNIMSHCLLQKSPDLCTVPVLLYLTMLKISLDCGVWASPMLFLLLLEENNLNPMESNLLQNDTNTLPGFPTNSKF